MWTFDHTQGQALRRPGLPLASAPGLRAIAILRRCATDVEFIGLNDTAELVLVGQHEPDRVVEPPGGGLADPQHLGQTDRGDALVRLQDQPHGSQMRSGSFVACSGVRVVTVNWCRQSGFAH